MTEQEKYYAVKNLLLEMVVATLMIGEDRIATESPMDLTKLLSDCASVKTDQIFRLIYNQP